MIKQEDVFKIEIDRILTRKMMDSIDCKLVIVVSAMYLGKENNKLGVSLLERFFSTLANYEILPKNIILYGEAVKLALKNSTIFDSLRELENEGVEILVSDTSADFFEVSELVQVGQICDMYAILDTQITASKVLNL